MNISGNQNRINKAVSWKYNGNSLSIIEVSEMASHLVYMVVTKLNNSGEQLTLKVLVETINAQWEGMGDVGSVRYEPALLPPCPTIRVLSYSS